MKMLNQKTIFSATMTTFLCAPTSKNTVANLIASEA